MTPRLATPLAIQRFLDDVPYSADPIYRSPKSVVRDRRAHCFDGAMFAAAALERIGHPPLLVDLRAVNDDDHVLAVFRSRGHIGAIAKSNYTGLRFREPIHRTLRELAISYFEAYFNSAGQKTLRSYSSTLDLRRFERLRWRDDDRAMDSIAAALDRLRHTPLLAPAAARALAPVDPRSLRAGLLGADERGLYRPA